MGGRGSGNFRKKPDANADLAGENNYIAYALIKKNGLYKMRELTIYNDIVMRIKDNEGDLAGIQIGKIMMALEEHVS